MTSTRFEIKSEVQSHSAIELKMPIDVFWDAEKIVKKMEYQHSAGEDVRTIKDTNNELFMLLLPYVLHEKDRAVLQEIIQPK